MNESTTTDARPSVAGFGPGSLGVTAPSNSDHQGAFVTDVIAELGFADRDTIANAVEVARNSARTPQDHLLESGAIDERQLSLALAERNGLDHVDLDRFEVDPNAVEMIAKARAARYTALPIAFATDGALLVAIDDPHSMRGLSTIEAMAGSEVRPVIAPGSQIRRLIERLPEEAPRPAPEPSPLPPQPAPVAAHPDSALEQPEPPVAVPPDALLESSGSAASGPAESEVEPGDLSIAFGILQEKMLQVGNLVEEVERRWRRSAERERELEQRLNEAQERIAALEESQGKTGTAGELAGAASEKLAELRGILDGPELTERSQEPSAGGSNPAG